MPANVFLALILLCTVITAPALTFPAEPSGAIVIAGNGPERPMIEDLARAFEKAHPRAYVDITWSKYTKILHMVRTGAADIAVTGKSEPDLHSHQIAWDGIALMIHISNTTPGVTISQVAGIFSGRIKSWLDLGGPDFRILLINRHPTQHLTHAFEESLGIAGQIPQEAKVIGPEQKTTNTVVGTLPPYSAVTYMSLTPALAAVKTGVAVRLLEVNNVEPEGPTVKDGRYPLRRPVLLLSRKESNPTLEAFVAFALSPEGQRIINRTYTSLDTKSSK